MTDQYTEISFNAGETLKASQLNTVVQNINIVNTQVENINTSITEINTAIAGKAEKPAGNENYATETYVKNYVDTEIADLVDSAPETLDTLNELAAALGNNSDFATTVATEIGKKVDKTTTINNKALISNITLSAADVGALPNTTEIPSVAGLATETYVNTKVAAITTSTLGAAKADDLNTLKNFLNLAVGTLNSFAVSDGEGGITWLKIPIAEDTTY